LYFTSYFRLFKYMVSFSRYFTVCITYQPPLILNFNCTSKSLHFISRSTFLTFFLYVLDFPALQNPFMSLTYHISAPFPGNFLDFLLTLNSLHFTSLITFLTLFLKILGLEGKVPKAFIGNLFQSWMVLYTNKYFLISVLCLLFLIFQS